MAGRQASSRPAKPKAEEHLVKAESNLEEYPFFAIKRRNRKLEPRVFERTLKSENEASLRQQWTVMPSAGYGTPGPLDQDVCLAVLELLERKGGMPANGKLRFSLYELVEILGWSKSGKNGGKVYRDVRDSLERIGATRIKSENAFYSKERDSYISDSFNTVRAVLTEYGVPVAARATCRAELTRPDNTGTTLAMPEVEPGVFEATAPALLAGIYRFRIVAEGQTLRGRPFSREQTLTGAVWKGGDTPPPTSKDDPNARDDRFCRLIDRLLRQKGIQGALQNSGIDSDELRRCLEEYFRKPAPGQPPHLARANLGDRLRSIIRDERTLQDVMREIEREGV